MIGSVSLVSRSTRTRSFLLIAILAAAFGLLAALAPRADAVPLAGSANPLPGSTFEGGDGDQAATLPRTDWQNASPINHSPDPNASDNIFAGGNAGKESAPGNWAFTTATGGSTPGKNNILDAWSFTDPLSADVFLNLAFTRSDDTGTTYMAFELNQRADMWVNSTGASIPCRTTGDIIVSVQVSGNSPDVILQKWTTGTTDATSGCAKTGSLTDFTGFVDNVDAQGAVNAGTIQNFLPVDLPWPGNQIPAKLFGEASLNLTTILDDALGTPCFSFGSIWMHTRASTSDSSNLDDYVAPRPLIVRNCSASGVKFHDLNGNGVKDAGEPGLAGFRIWADYDQDGVRDTGAGAEPFADTDANGNYTITNVQDPSGNYNLREQLPGGGTGGWICSFPTTTATGGDFPCAHTGINGATTPNATGKNFGNYKNPTIRVEKDLVPSTDAGRFDLKVDTTTVKTAAGDEDGATQTVTIGSHSVSEVGNGTTDLTKYDSTVSCTKNGTAYLSGNGASLANISVQSGDAVVCRIQNTRKKASITVRKQLVPETDPGRFDLKVGATTVKAAAGDNESGSLNVDPGSYTVSEAAAGTTDLAKYDSSWACTKNGVAGPTGTGTSLAGISVDSNDVVVCEVTNVRRKAGITVVKQLVPENDAGRFDLKVDSTVVKAAAGDDQSGSLNVDPGSYTVSEAAGNASTDLTKYDSSIACLKNGAAYKSGTGTSISAIAVDSNDAVTCTITNSRRPANILVRKQLVPESDPGKFALSVGATVVNASAGDNQGGNLDVAPGSYSVSEAGANGTDLLKYDSSWACTKNGVAGPTGTGTSLSGITVDSNDTVICEVTNVRRKAGITVVKQLVPENDAGRFDLKVGATVVKTAAGDDQGGTANVDPGSYTVSEVGNATDLSKYDSDVACVKNGAAYKSGTGTSLSGVEVDSNDAVTCTITNARRPANIEVVKQLVPESDAGRFDLSVDSTVVKAAAGDNEGGDLDVAPGTYTVSEAAANTDLAKYDKSWSCTKNGAAGPTGTGASLSGIAVDSNDTVVCEITNTRRKASITVRKQLVPENDEGRFDLSVGTTVVKAAAGDNEGGSTDVAPGSYTVSEAAGNASTDLTKYDSSWSCTKNGAAGPTGTGASLSGVSVDSNDVVVCEVTNTRREANIKVVKQLVPESDAGKFDLKVGATVVKAAAGDNEGGDLDVAPGTYSVSETAGNAGTNLGNYDSSWACSKNGVAYKTGSGTSLAGLAVDSNDEVVCEVTNARRKAGITVIKQLVPDTDPGRFALSVDDTVVVASAGNNQGDTLAVAPGSYEVSEASANADTVMAKYDSSVACVKNGDDYKSGEGTSLDGIAVDSNDAVTCVFTNTRRPANIKVVKQLVPETDAGRFDLSVDGTLVKAAAGDNEGGDLDVAPGTYGASEAGAGATDLAKYDSSWSCTKDGLEIASGNGASIGGLEVDSNDAVVCEVTNVRRKAGITVIKQLVPENDQGTFDLKVGDDVVKAGAGDNQGGTANVDPGSYTVSESGANGTDLAKYDSDVDCVKNGEEYKSGDGTSLDEIVVDSNDAVTCTITNARRPANISVVKQLVPETDEGRFDLSVDTTVVKAAAGDDEGGNTDVAPGSYTVSEAGALGTDLAKYDSSWSCTKNGDAGPTGTGASLSGISVDSNDKVVCEVTNTRRQANITVVKQLVPETDAGRFDLSVDTTVVKAAAGDNEGGDLDVAPGTYSVSEAAGNAGTDLAKYDKAWECTKNGTAYKSGSGVSLGGIAVDSNDDVVCEITNTRRKASITVRKQLVPESDPGKFDLSVDTTVVKAAAGDNEGGSTDVAPGSYTVSEAEGNASTSLAKYDSSWVCTKNGLALKTGTGTSLGGIAVDSNDTVVCEVTNVRRKAGITVVKQLVPENDEGRFDLSVDDTVVKAAAGDDQGGTANVDPGSYTVSEAGANGTDLTKYDSDVACVKNGDDYKSGDGTSLTGIAVDSNDAVTCTITNSRRAANIKVVKQLVPETDAGRFDLSVGGTVVKAAAGDNEGGDLDVAPGSYTVSEAAANTDLAKYDSSWACTKNGDPYKTGSGASLDEIAVDSNDDVTCEVTNVRRKAGITVVKQLVPEGDQGRFDLLVDQTVVKAAAGDDEGGTAAVDPGSYTVSEAAGNATTDLAKYDSDVACVKNGDPYKSGDGSALAGIAVDSNDAVTCTITNTRRPANIKIIKQLVPETDAGRFDLSVDSTVVKAAAGDNEGGDLDVVPGTYEVSEAAGNAGTDLTKYDSSWSCRMDGEEIASGNGASLDGIAVDSNDKVVCEVTNVRRQAGITVVKQLVPDTDAGRFDLKVDDTVVKAAAGDGDSGNAPVDPGTYTVSEVAGNAGTDLAKYDSDIACVKNGEAYTSGDGTSLGGIAVDSNDAVTCTITNERRPANIEVVKQLVPDTDPGTFDLSVGDTVVRTAAGDNEGGSADVAPGTYSASEDAAGDTDMATYDASWACTKNEQAYKTGTGTAISGLDVDSNDHVRCEVTNTKRAHVQILKTEAGATPDGTWTFQITGGPDSVDITHTTDSEGKIDFGFLKPGDYTLCERGIPSGWHTSLERAPYNGTRQADGAGMVKVCVPLTLTAGQSDPIAVDNTKPGTLVVKEGNVLVHHGDTITYTFDVSNNGNTPLHDVSVEDDRCDSAPVRDAAHDTNADVDALLEPAGTPDATKSEVWRFTCTKQVSPDHAANEENPIHNIATAHALDEGGNEVTAEDTHDTTIIHPGIDVDKTLRSGEGGFVQGPIQVHVGDTVDYSFAVTNTGDTPLAVEFSDPMCDAGTLSGPTGDADSDGKLDLTETWVYKCSHVVANDDPDPLVNTVTVTGTDSLGGDKGTVTETDTAAADILKPGTLVVKEGNVFAYPGDTVTYTFAVTNNGNTPLSDVHVTDDKCAPVSATPTQKINDDGDATLDPIGADGQTPEKWIFSCTTTVPASHKIGDTNPIHNIATATGKDTLGKTVTATDDHDLVVLHPAIDIEKTGPATATVGETLAYTLTVTNPGDVAFAAQTVGVTDPRCSQPPVLQGKGADQTPNQFDPGDTWTYTCSADTTGQAPGTFVNTATVTAKDTNGHSVTDTDDFPTQLNAQQVIPEEVVHGTARLQGPSGCVRNSFGATVRGSRIAQITFFLDGKRVKRITAKEGQTAFRVNINPRKVGRGVHRVTAKVLFVTASQTKSKTLRLSFQRCRKQVVRPRFTG